ncbi:hypothetical protein [Aliikangiella sp. IMCC44359]|uniref:hypothetical protein n=1 Tax=Aliikangiella sp. IMCC44359 TaxID=3459125 RepID=UPI00403A89DE
MPEFSKQTAQSKNNHPVAAHKAASHTVLEDNRASSIQRMAIAPSPLQSVMEHDVMQREVIGGELDELRLFFDREIMQIGSPTSDRNRKVFQDAAKLDSLAAAKKYISEYIESVKAFIETESLDPELQGVDKAQQSLARPDTHYTFSDLKDLGLDDRMSKIMELSGQFAMTDFEQERLDRASDERALVPFYRYHKFPDDPSSRAMVTGGFFNKSMLSNDETGDNFHNATVRKILKERSQSFGVLSGPETSIEERTKKAKRMEKFQASARNTPFIATTTDWDYAASLFQEYPPGPGQVASILTILGPLENAFDFEREFERLAVGESLNNYRTSEHRAKDAQQAEFGIPDMFIPVTGVSRLGFRIANVTMFNEVMLASSSDNSLADSYFSKLTKIDLTGLKFTPKLVQMMFEILDTGALKNLRTIYVKEDQLPPLVIQNLQRYVKVVVQPS